jgi:hypothetical protein
MLLEPYGLDPRLAIKDLEKLIPGSDAGAKKNRIPDQDPQHNHKIRQQEQRCKTEFFLFCPIHCISVSPKAIGLSEIRFC